MSHKYFYHYIEFVNVKSIYYVINMDANSFIIMIFSVVCILSVLLVGIIFKNNYVILNDEITLVVISLLH